jgi:hypothetical protein
MIVVRDIFRLKFGQAKEATALWKQAAQQLKQAGAANVRLLTDLAGPAYYTLIFESEHASLAAWEGLHTDAKLNAAFREIYQKIIPLTEDGRREILSVVS